MFSKVLLFVMIYASLKFFIWLLRSFEGSPKKIKKMAKPIHLAVAIPAHNEGTSIARTVRSILKAGVPAEDIYVICNGCTDNTAEEVRKCGVEPIMAPTHGKEETLAWADEEIFLNQKNRNKYSAICFFDADTEIDKKYFKVIRDCFRNDPTIDIICGRPKSLPHNWLTAHRAVQYWAFHAVHKAAQAKMSAILVVPGCAGIYTVNALRKIVWSPDTRIGDMDATIQAAKLGMKIVFEPKAIVYTQDPSNLRDYTNQLYRRWNRGLWMNMRKHGLLWKGPWIGRASLVNWDCRMIFFDQFAPLLYLAIILIFRLKFLLFPSFGVYLGFMAYETLGCAIKENRWDVVKYFPIFLLMRVLDMLLFLAAMPNIFVKKEKSGVWESPTRYHAKES
jgi:cellulose synthase/poly-beta-1,6-N-acetylglucosamine synthase-like glycosyltransferase